MFKSPDKLRQYTLAIAAQLRSEGYKEQSNILESVSNLPCTTGWEWLGELSLEITKLKTLGELPEEINLKLEKALKTTKSSKPYG